LTLRQRAPCEAVPDQLPTKPLFASCADPQLATLPPTTWLEVEAVSNAAKPHN